MFLWRNLRSADVVAALAVLSDKGKQREENTPDHQQIAPKPGPDQPATSETA